MANVLGQGRCVALSRSVPCAAGLGIAGSFLMGRKNFIGVLPKLSILRSLLHEALGQG